MLPLQDEIAASFILADRLAAADRARLVRAVAPRRSSRGHHAVAALGHALVRFGSRLEAAGDRPALVATTHLTPPSDRFARI
jgi:hypothetical protein